MAISRSSALKINTEAWITFSITIPLKQNTLASLRSSLYVFTLILCVCVCALPCMFGLLEESLALKLSSRRMETQVGLRSRVVLRLIIHQSNVTAQRAKNRADQLRCCCCVKIPTSKFNCNIQPLKLPNFKGDSDKSLKIKIRWFYNSIFAVTDCIQSRTSEGDPVGAWFTYSLRAAHPSV